MNTIMAHGISVDDPLVNRMLVQCLQDAGEQVARGKLSIGIKEIFSNVEWEKIESIRHMYSHAYEKVKPKIVLSIFKHKLPIWLEQLYEIQYYLKRQLDSEQGGY